MEKIQKLRKIMIGVSGMTTISLYGLDFARGDSGAMHAMDMQSRWKKPSEHGKW